MLERSEAKVVQDVEQRQHGKGKVTPLVRALDQCADKTSDDHDFVNEDDEENGRDRRAGSKKKVQKKQGSSDDPVDVSNVEDLSSLGTTELDFDWDLYRVRLAELHSK